MADDDENANAYILDLRDGILLISIASVNHEKNILLWRKTPLGAHVTRMLTVCRNVCHPAT